MRGRELRKRGTNRAYVLDIGRSENGKRKQKWVGGYKTRRDAQAALNETIGRLNQGTFVEPSKQTVTEYLREWLPTIEATVKATTWHSYVATIEDHVVPTIGSPFFFVTLQLRS